MKCESGWKEKKRDDVKKHNIFKIERISFKRARCQRGTKRWNENERRSVNVAHWHICCTAKDFFPSFVGIVVEGDWWMLSDSTHKLKPKDESLLGSQLSQIALKSSNVCFHSEPSGPMLRRQQETQRWRKKKINTQSFRIEKKLT